MSENVNVVEMNIYPSNYIMKLDIKDKAALMMVLTKLESGVLMMSSTYCRFYQAILPMVTMIEEKADKPELVELVRKKFASILRTYIRTDKLSKKEQTSLYNMKTEMFDIRLDPSVKQLETHIVVTLGDIDKALESLMNQLLGMVQDQDIAQWGKNGQYESISKSIKNLNTAIMYVFDDFEKAFMDGDSIKTVEALTALKFKFSDNAASGICSLREMLLAIDSSVGLISALYQVILTLHYNLGSKIDIVNPIDMSDSTRTVKELYEDFCDMNDNAIADSSATKGFDPTIFKKKKRSFLFWKKSDDDEYED